jgi:putative DNA modification/repair radical SAM protein
MISCLELLRGEMRFNGYVHAKAIPGTSPDLIDRLGRLADRLSVNVELPSAGSLSALCPDKTSSAITAPMAQIASTIVGERRLGAGDGRRDSTQADGLAQVPRSDANRRRAGLGRRGARAGSFAPAGQATQLIIGASPEDDNHILQLSRSMYERFGLKRVFFSAYMPVVDDPILPRPGTPVPLRREHRLYQADWLMRYYSFSPDELVSAEEPWLDLDVDPKLAWALRNIDRFPIEVNEAPLEQLLRVPGIGVTGARKIVRARRGHALTFDDLGRLRIVMRRARHFVTCSDSIDPACPLDAELIRQRVVSDASSSRYNRTQRAADRQLSLF